MHDIPILQNHDYEKVIGVWKRDGTAEFRQDQRITQDQLLQIFGGAGIRVLEWFEDATGRYVRSFEIMEFSLCPTPNTGEPPAAADR